MTGWLVLLALGGMTQTAPVQAADADLARCRDESRQRDDAAVVASCSAALASSGLTDEARARLQAFRARAYARQFDYRHAAPDYRAAWRAGVNEPAVPNGLCWSLAVLGEALEEARAACDARLRAVPDDAETLDSRGLVNLKQGRLQEAWNDYDRAFRINPQGVSWLYGRGIAALRLGRTAEGRQDIDSAEAGYPGIGAMFARYGIRP